MSILEPSTGHANVPGIETLDNTFIEFLFPELQKEKSPEAVKQINACDTIFIDGLDCFIAELLTYIGYAIKHGSETECDVYGCLMDITDETRLRNSISRFNNSYQVLPSLQQSLKPSTISSTKSYRIDIRDAIKLLTSTFYDMITVDKRGQLISHTVDISTVLIILSSINKQTINNVDLKDNSMRRLYFSWILLVIEIVIRLGKLDANYSELDFQRVCADNLIYHDKLFGHTDNQYRLRTIYRVVFGPLLELEALTLSTSRQNVLYHGLASGFYDKSNIPFKNLSKELLYLVTAIVPGHRSYSERIRVLSTMYIDIPTRLKAEQNEIQHSAMGTIYLRKLVVDDFFNGELYRELNRQRQSDMQGPSYRRQKLEWILQFCSTATKAWMMYIRKTRLVKDQIIIIEQFIRILAALSILEDYICTTGQLKVYEVPYDISSIDYESTLPKRPRDAFSSIFYLGNGILPKHYYIRRYEMWMHSRSHNIYPDDLLYMEMKRARIILDCKLPIDIPCVEEWWTLTRDLESMQAARDRRLPLGEYSDILKKERMAIFTPFITSLAAGLVALTASILDGMVGLYTLPLILVALIGDILISWGCIDGRIGTFKWYNMAHSWALFITDSNINGLQSEYYSIQQNGPIATIPSDIEDNNGCMFEVLSNISNIWKIPLIQQSYYSLADASEFLAHLMSENRDALNYMIRLEIFYGGSSQWQNRIEVSNSDTSKMPRTKFSLQQNTSYGAKPADWRISSNTQTSYGKHSVVITGPIGYLLKEKQWLMRVPFRYKEEPSSSRLVLLKSKIRLPKFPKMNTILIRFKKSNTRPTSTLNPDIELGQV